MEPTKKPDPQAVALGRRLQRLRKRLKLSRKQVADLIGKHGNTLGKYERGEADMRAVDVPRLAAALQTDVATVLGERSEGLGLRANRSGNTYLVVRGALRRIEQARSIAELRDLFNVGLEAGYVIPPEAEEVTIEEWGRIEQAMEARIAALGGIPREW